MTKAKKFLALVLSVAMCLTMMVGCFTASAASGTITVGTTTIDVGTAPANVTITISGPNFAAGQFTVNYGTLPAPTVTSDKKVSSEAAGTGLVNVLVESGEQSVDNITTATVTLAFAGLDNLAIGDYAITVSNIDFADYDENPVEFAAAAGKITVQEAAQVCEHINKTFVKIEDGKYYYTCDDCTEDVIIAAGPDYSGAALTTKKVISPTNDISMTFRFARDNIQNAYHDFVLAVTKDDYAKGVATATEKEYFLTTYEETTNSSVNYFTFKFTDLACYQMTSNVNCVLYGIDNTTGLATKIASVDDFSVSFYVYSQLANLASAAAGTSSAKLRTALVDLLNYGAAAQILGNYDVAHLVNAGLTPTQAAWATPDANLPTTATAFTTVDTEIGALAGSNDSNKVTVTKTLNPGATVSIQFRLKEHAGDINNYYVKFSYFNAKGVAQETAVLSYAEAGYRLASGAEGFVFNQAPITVMDYPVTATIYYGNPADGGVEVYSSTFSIETYVAGNIRYVGNANASLANLGAFLQRMYAYGKSMGLAANVTPYTP